VRERVLMAFEEAEREPDPAKRKALLTFVVIGAGPTGVEMAGAISELSRMTLRDDFRVVDPTAIRVILVEAADRVLTPFTPELSARAKESLEELVVDVWIGRRVTSVGDGWIEVDGERVPASVVVWAAGVMPVSLAAALGVPTERGQIVVGQDCSLPGHPEAFAIGDIARFVPDGEQAPLPGLGAVAIQQGRYVADVIAARAAPGERARFRYVDKGIMATIGRSRAVAQTSDFLLSGYTAWLAWLFVHLILLIGFRNRVAVLLSWFWSYVTFRRGARLITRTTQPPGRTLEAELKREHALPGSSGSSLGAAEVRDERA
jgi:NADH dehydrogenase